MKLKDVIAAVGNRRDWIKFYWNWYVAGDGVICPSSEIQVNMDDEVAIIYQWYHHFDPSLDRNEVWNAIEQLDYETFYKWYKMFEDDHWVYFPSEAYIFVGDECVGEVCVAYDPRVFSLITDQDHECG